jgi:hypothetical protein
MLRLRRHESDWAQASLLARYWGSISVTASAVSSVFPASCARPSDVRLSSALRSHPAAGLVCYSTCRVLLPCHLFFFANPCPAHRSFIITSPSCCQLLLMMGDHLLLNEFPNHQFTGYQLDSWGEEVLSIRSCSSGVRQIGLTRILRTFS